MVNGKNILFLYKGNLRTEIVIRKWSTRKALSFCDANIVVATCYLPTF
jgi:hypothetical protein